MHIELRDYDPSWPGDFDRLEFSDDRTGLWELHRRIIADDLHGG
jgi:hypothetical protein